MKTTAFFGWGAALVLLVFGSLASAGIREVLDAYEAEMKVFSEGYANAVDDEKRSYVDEHYPKPEATGEALKALIAETPADVAVPEACGWLLVRMRNDLPEGMVDVLRKHHLENPGLAEFVMMGAYSIDASVGAFIEELAESSPVAQTKAAAAYTVASRLGNSPKAEDQARRERLLEEAKAGIGELTLRGQRIGEMIDGALFEARHLSLGKEAPEIEGEDVEGVAFKLSDYRGRVVVIDFWGDW